MRRFISTLLGGRLQIVLIASFSLVAALTVGLNTVVISRVINDYLAEAMDERVARDMDLADAFYQLGLDEVTSSLLISRSSTRSPSRVWAARISSSCWMSKAALWRDGLCRQRANCRP
jgi:hypothetical protein